MRYRYVWVFIILILAVKTETIAQTHKMVLVKGGTYTPIYGTDSNQVKVNDFYMDEYPVTNEDFQDFVKKNPNWQKSHVKKIFADENYLSNWANDTSLGKNVPTKSPVTMISWFAAKDYCQCQGKRLPTVDEWEYAAMADEKKPDARRDDTYNKKILEWYEARGGYQRLVGSTFKNYWGIYDMHGLVWEWNADFNSVFISGESRKDGSSDTNLFCGSAAIGSTNLMNYAAFMRYAFRGSLKANFTIKNLGFRCAKDAQ